MFRGGNPPAGLADEVDDLRDLGPTVLPSAEVGTMPGSGHVDPLGQGGYSIPIDVPPGAGGLAPALSLDYSSGGGNGFWGVGWGVSGFSQIHRCPDTIADDGAFAPIDFDDNDALCLDGERLVVVSGTPFHADAEYRTRRDPFSRITGRDEGGARYFEVEYRDGRIATYGLAHALERGSERYAWMIEEIRDRYGNDIDYAYDAVSLNGEVVGLRPRVLAWEGGHVTFVEDPGGRLDESHGFDTGNRFAVLDRFEAIEVYGGGGDLISTYHLTYDYEDNTVPTRSLLTSIEKCDAAGACLPATTLEYWPPFTDIELPPSPLPGIPEGIRHLDQFQQEDMVWPRRSIVGDFNGDLSQEVIVWDPHESAFKVFRSDYSEFSAYVFDLGGVTGLPPSWDWLEMNLDMSVRFASPAEPYAGEYTPTDWDLHQVSLRWATR